MTKEELAKHIKDRVVLIGTYLKHLESIQKYAKDNKAFCKAFTTIYLSLENTVYIELFKLVDNQKDTRLNSIYGLIDIIEDENKTYHKKISIHNETISAIRNRRNKLFAHDTGVDPSEIYKNNKIESLQSFLESVSGICCDVNSQLTPNIYTSNVRDFDDWCCMATTSINKMCKINNENILKAHHQ